jgi:hypothetical protein
MQGHGHLLFLSVLGRPRPLLARDGVVRDVLDPLSESISEVLKRIIPWLEGKPPTAEPELPRGANDNAPTRKLLATT